MNIAGTEINLQRAALEIYLSGCRSPHCAGCHNRELWDFTVGSPLEAALPLILKKIDDAKSSGLVRHVWVLGGEPLHQQEEELCALLTVLRRPDLALWLWTRFSAVPRNVAKLLDYAKTGAYVPEEKPWTEPLFGLRLAGKNQKIVKLRP